MLCNRSLTKPMLSDTKKNGRSLDDFCIDVLHLTVAYIQTHCWTLSPVTVIPYALCHISFFIISPLTRWKLVQFVHKSLHLSRIIRGHWYIYLNIIKCICIILLFVLLINSIPLWSFVCVHSCELLFMWFSGSPYPVYKCGRLPV